MIGIFLLTLCFASDDGFNYDGNYHPDDVAGPHSPDVAVFPEDPNPEFWVFRDNGATVVNARTKDVVAVVDVPSEITSEGTTYSMEPVTHWGDTVEVASESHIYINDRINEMVHIFDTTTRSLWRSVKTAGGRNVHMYYIPQLHEIWTHTDATGAFDVIRGDNGEVTHTQVQANWAVNSGHGKLVYDDVTYPIGFATTTNEGRVIKINLETKQAVGMVDLIYYNENTGLSYNCSSTHYIGFSRVSQRVIVQCSRGPGDACDRHACNNGGSCVLQGGETTAEQTAMCICADGYTGTNCDDTTTDDAPDRTCDTNHCQNGAACMKADNGSPMCVCSSAFYGPTCHWPVATGTFEIDANTDEIKQFWPGVSGGIHVSPIAEEYWAVNMGGTRQCANPGWMSHLDDCADGELIYPEGTVDFYSVNNGDNGLTEIHLQFAVNGGPSRVIWVPKANSDYYWSVWAMVSSQYLYSFDMEKVHTGQAHEPGLIEVGMMKQEGHGSRYLDVGGNYIIGQANLVGGISVIDISDSDCLGRSGNEACPRALVLHESFDTAKGVVYARPPGYLQNQNNRDGTDSNANNNDDDSDEAVGAWVWIVVAVALLVCLGAVFYVYRYQTVIVMQKETKGVQPGTNIPSNYE